MYGVLKFGFCIIKFMGPIIVCDKIVKDISVSYFLYITFFLYHVVVSILDWIMCYYVYVLRA
jgi:hypothetical protein